MAAAIKKDCIYRNKCGIQLHDDDLEHSLKKEKKNRSSYVFSPFLCSVIPDLDLGILKIGE